MRRGTMTEKTICGRVYLPFGGLDDLESYYRNSDDMTVERNDIDPLTSRCLRVEFLPLLLSHTASIR